MFKCRIYASGLQETLHSLLIAIGYAIFKLMMKMPYSLQTLGKIAAEEARFAASPSIPHYKAR